MQPLASCLSFFGFRSSSSEDHEPLLPQYEDDTRLQRALHQKLHTYRMIQALRQGYVPSNEQTIANLRSLLAADILNPTNSLQLSDSGRLLTKYLKRWLHDLISFLQHKNQHDQIQDFFFHLSKSRVSIDAGDVVRRANKAKVKADSLAAFRSLQTIGSLLLTNAQFRLFLADLNVVGRQILQDTAHALSGVAEEAGNKLAPSDEAVEILQKPGEADDQKIPSGDDLGDEVTEAGTILGNSAAKVVEGARNSAIEKFSGPEKESLLYRLQQTVLRLRQRPDYSESVSTLGLLLKRWALIYSRAAQDSASVLQDDVRENQDADLAVKSLYQVVSSFGNKHEWKELESRLSKLMSHLENDPELENFMDEVADALQQVLTDPEFFTDAEKRIQDLRNKFDRVGADSPVRKDLDSFFDQAQTTYISVIKDEDVAKVFGSTKKVVEILSPTGEYMSAELLSDVLDAFGPLLIGAIQTIPIPRVEISTPEIDLLLENIILTPGLTVNQSSFLPYRLGISTQNDIEVRKARTRIASSVTSLVTIKLDGFCVKAEELGFWLRTHSGILRFMDEGIASFDLDERGVDIHIDVEIARERLEQILTLRAVRIHIHKLNFNLRSSKFSLLAWILRPMLRPIIRKVLERQLANAVADMFHAANRELIFARERLRATRIADPQDLLTFFKAITARLMPEDDPDVYSRVGLDEPGKGVFKGVFAPGSLVKMWREERVEGRVLIEDGGQVKGWRNDVFDIHGSTLA